jgi:hypothetical protein
VTAPLWPQKKALVCRDSTPVATEEALVCRDSAPVASEEALVCRDSAPVASRLECTAVRHNAFIVAAGYIRKSRTTQTLGPVHVGTSQLDRGSEHAGGFCVCVLCRELT